MTCRRDSIRYRGLASSGSARGGTLPRDLGRRFLSVGRDVHYRSRTNPIRSIAWETSIKVANHDAIRGPSRADPRTSSARTNRENLPTNTWADWRTSRSPSGSPTVADSSNRLVQPLVKESRRRRHSPSQQPDDRSNCLRPMDTDVVPAMLHPWASNLASN